MKREIQKLYKHNLFEGTLAQRKFPVFSEEFWGSKKLYKHISVVINTDLRS